MLHLLETIHGSAKKIRLTLLYEIHTIDCFPCDQRFTAYAGLVKCMPTSDGKPVGTGGAPVGNVSLE